MTTTELEYLFSNMKENAEKVIELRLDEMEQRMKELEEEGDYRSILAICQEYLEWGKTEQGEDYNMFWMENLID
tara:strand:+ start:491 stop:712 length:222 start_codon:yes stop_codon:yes gene_type:complete